MRRHLVLLAGVLLASGCRTPQGGDGSKVLEEAGAQAPTVSPPFASGTSDGLDWEVRFNLPVCDHSNEGRRAGAWCTIDDFGPSAEKNGVEARLISWIKDPAVKQVYMAYFSFSNKAVRRELCNEARNRGLKAILYIHSQSASDANVQELATCSPQNIKVVRRGTEFGSGYLQHAKIFLATEIEGMDPLADMTAEAAQNAAQTKIRWTTSSANMSSFGTTLHFENWLFFTAPASDYLAQANLCVFKAFRDMQGSDRQSYARLYKSCREAIAASPRQDIQFFMNPHADINPAPFPAMRAMLNGAQRDIKVAIHRLTTSSIYRLLAQKAQQGKRVRLIFDDDTLRTGVQGGGVAHDVGANDVQAYREVRDGGVEVTFMETNADSTTHLFHNKFIVVDDSKLFVGAGNFTSASLNTYGLGNFEQFYVITEPGIVKAYADGWEELRRRSTPANEHPVGNNPEKRIRCDGGLCNFVN